MASAEKELEAEVAQLRPKTRYQDLAIRFRRLTVATSADIELDAEFKAEDGTRIRVKRNGDVLAAGSDPPGASTHLEDGAKLLGVDGEATLRVEVLAEFGGRWDHRENCWSKAKASAPMVLDVQESQVEFVRWFCERWRAFKAGRSHPKTSAMLLDDRGGGKTFIVFMLMFAATLEHPKHRDGAEFVPWLVSVTHPARREVDRELRTWIPKDWYHLREWPMHQLHLVNGGLISLMSADDANSLRQGRVDLLWINEGALLTSAALENAVVRTKDRKGFAIITSNPPTPDCPRGAWVQEVYELSNEAEEAGERNPVSFIRCSSKLNVLQDRETSADVATLLRWLNPDRADADADGLVKPVGKYAYRPPFAMRRHVRPLVESEWARRDITRTVTLKHCGTAYDWIIGSDFQSRPAMCGAAMKVYDTPEQPTVVIWSAFWVEGDEDDYINAIEQDLEWVEHFKGSAPRFTRSNSVFIGDPSGTWQDGGHTPGGFSGKDSFSMFRARQYRILPPMKPKDPTKKPPHPPVYLRVARMNGLLAEDRLLIAENPTTASIALSLRNCPLWKSGFRMIPKPGANETHLPDAAGYAIWWIIPRFTSGTATVRGARSLGAGWRSR